MKIFTPVSRVASPLLLLCGLGIGGAALAQDGVADNNVGVDQETGIGATPAANEGRTPNETRSDTDEVDVDDRVEPMSEAGVTSTPTTIEQQGEEPLVVDDQDRNDGLNVHPSQADSAVGDSDEDPNVRR